MATTKNVKTLHVWDTEYSADSVEWCPFIPYQNVFVCGTYQITENENDKEDVEASSSISTEGASQHYNRLGRLYLFAVHSSKGLCLLQTLEMPAILDTKWCHCKVDGRMLLGVANAIGNVLIYEMCANKEFTETDEWVSCRLSLLCNQIIAQEGSSETLALSLDWSTGRCMFEDVTNNPHITVSDSKGHITALKLTDLSLEKTMNWKAHGFEAWITAFDYWNSSVIYTGGDDCKFNVYDLRIGTDHPSLSSRIHEAGVTSLHSNAFHEHLLASGSYDENIRIWDTRHMKQPTYTKALGGGVWRLKWDPHRWQHILAACMHGGFRILNFMDNTKPPCIVGRYDEHQSLAYGSDWCYLLGAEVVKQLPEDVSASEENMEDFRIMATCSFYDHKLCVSVIQDLLSEQL